MEKWVRKTRSAELSSSVDKNRAQNFNSPFRERCREREWSRVKAFCPVLYCVLERMEREVYGRLNGKSGNYQYLLGYMSHVPPCTFEACRRTLAGIQYSLCSYKSRASIMERVLSQQLLYSNRFLCRLFRHTGRGTYINGTGGRRSY